MTMTNYVCGCGHHKIGHMMRPLDENGKCSEPGCKCERYDERVAPPKPDEPRNGSENATDGVRLTDSTATTTSSRIYNECVCGHFRAAHLHIGIREPHTCGFPGCRCVQYRELFEGRPADMIHDGLIPYCDNSECKGKCGRPFMLKHKDGSTCRGARVDSCSRVHLIPHSTGTHTRMHDEFPLLVACVDCAGSTTVEFVRCSKCVEAGTKPRVVPRPPELDDIIASPEIALIAHNLRELPKLSLDERIRVATYMMQYVQDTAMPVGRAPKKG